MLFLWLSAEQSMWRLRKTRIKSFIFFTGIYKIRQQVRKEEGWENEKGARYENKIIIQTENAITQLKCALEVVKKKKSHMEHAQNLINNMEDKLERLHNE